MEVGWRMLKESYRRGTDSGVLIEGECGGTYGRKLQAEAGREETRVKISEIKRCWTDVSCLACEPTVSWHSAVQALGVGAKMYQLGVEFREARLAGVVEDEDGVDHRCGG